MEEQRIIKKQLRKNMLFTFITFTIIFTIFDLIIFNLISTSIYNSVDEQLISATENIDNQIFKQSEKFVKDDENKPEDFTEVEEAKLNENEKPTNIRENQMNPRFIWIERDENGNITNADALGSFYSEYIDEIYFNKDNLDELYTTSINEEFFYRGITLTWENEEGETEYIQILVNVDGEKQAAVNTLKTLIITTIIMIVISIAASYIISKKTLAPIIESWKRQTEFVQNVSHELRTPLTILQAKQELLLQEPDKKIIDKSKDINVCLNETRRLSKLVKELLVLARADSDKLQINKESINIDVLVKQVSAPYIELANMQNKKIELKLNYGKEIMADKNRISQLLVIILDNAIKYISEGENIIVSTQEKDGKLNLEIADTGIGISKEAMKHVFERFYREDKARSRETGGTGLGLSIAQTIVLAHKGSIKIVENKPKGTRVIVKI